jgi:hypothetical protein
MVLVVLVVIVLAVGFVAGRRLHWLITMLAAVTIASSVIVPLVTLWSGGFALAV